jgi:hypothetical protein
MEVYLLTALFVGIAFTASLTASIWSSIYSLEDILMYAPVIIAAGFIVSLAWPIFLAFLVTLLIRDNLERIKLWRLK